MKISIIGSRGLPARYGGFETFAEEISTLLADEGHYIIVQCEPSAGKSLEYKGVTLFHSSVTKSRHTMRYYFEGVIMGLRESDVIIATGVGAAIFYVLNIFRHRIIITITDGIEYRRSKWSFLKRSFLRLSEAIAVKMSDVLIADSKAIRNYLMKKYSVQPARISVIEYGAHLNEEKDISIPEKYKLIPNEYYITVCRLEPENNLDMILEGHRLSGTSNPILVIGALINNDYVTSLVRKFSSDKVIFADGIYNKKELSSLRYFCRAYIHGHTVGGTNPSLLEAMASRNVVICHNNEFNMEVTAGRQLYFFDKHDCAESIRRVDSLKEVENERFRHDSLNRVLEYYRWDLIVAKYRTLLGRFEDRKGTAFHD